MAPKRRLSPLGRREMEKGKWLDDFLKRPPATRPKRRGEREESETMSRIAVTGQFSSTVSFSVFFFSLFLPPSLLFDGQSSSLSLLSSAISSSACLPGGRRKKKGEMISSNCYEGDEERNDMSSVHDARCSWDLGCPG